MTGTVKKKKNMTGKKEEQQLDAVPGVIPCLLKSSNNRE
jgi:hypothetical protein